MKNLVENTNHTKLIVALAAGAIVAGGLAYLFLTDDGQEAVESIKHKIKDLAKDLAAGFISDKTGINKEPIKHVADAVSE